MYSEKTILHNDEHHTTLLPTLICPKLHTPIILVKEDDNDIMKSSLLSARSVCSELQVKTVDGNTKIVVVDDFLR